MSIEYPFIAERIADAMQSLGGFAEHLPPLIQDSGEQLGRCLVQGNKIHIAGSEAMHWLAQLFAGNLVHSHALTRPSLPVMALDGRNIEQCSRELQLWGSSNDALIVLGSNDPQLPEALLAVARQRGMSSLVIGAIHDGLYQQSWPETLFLPVDYTAITRMHEMTLFILNCLSDIIDAQLFGEHS